MPRLEDGCGVSAGDPLCNRLHGPLGLRRAPRGVVPWSPVQSRSTQRRTRAGTSTSTRSIPRPTTASR